MLPQVTLSSSYEDCLQWVAAMEELMNMQDPAMLGSMPAFRDVATEKKTIIGGDYVVHSLRHSLRDRLRAVECPSDIIDQIGGWTTTGIGHAYGKGYSVEILAKWMKKIEC